MKIRVTICELRDESAAIEQDIEQLLAHVKKEKSDIVLLPEMALSSWFAWKKGFESCVWEDAVRDHNRILDSIGRVAPAIALGSRPVNSGGRRFNEAFVLESAAAYRAAHHKYYLPNENGYWEANWYDRGSGEFEPVKTRVGLIGFSICSDMWFFEHAREYGRKGVGIIACPRATPEATYGKWLASGRAASVVSGAYSISSCKVNDVKDKVDLGGHGWIIEPDGKVLGETSPNSPFLTMEIDLNLADKAKKTYPRYIPD